jgi:hypothetical protein
MLLPELVREVLLHLHGDHATLHVAILVNRMWFASGIVVLRSKLAHSALSYTAPSPQQRRRQFYADMITATHGIPTQVLADNLLLPSCSAQNDPLFARILLYIQPTLEELRCDLSQVMLDRLMAQRLPRLRMLHVSGTARKGDSASSESFVDGLLSRRRCRCRSSAFAVCHSLAPRSWTERMACLPSCRRCKG